MLLRHSSNQKYRPPLYRIDAPKTKHHSSQQSQQNVEVMFTIVTLLKRIMQKENGQSDGILLLCNYWHKKRETITIRCSKTMIVKTSNKSDWLIYLACFYYSVSERFWFIESANTMNQLSDWPLANENNVLMKKVWQMSCVKTIEPPQRPLSWFWWERRRIKCHSMHWYSCFVRRKRTNIIFKNHKNFITSVYD